MKGGLEIDEVVDDVPVKGLSQRRAIVDIRVHLQCGPLRCISDGDSCELNIASVALHTARVAQGRQER